MKVRSCTTNHNNYASIQHSNLPQKRACEREREPKAFGSVPPRALGHAWPRVLVWEAIHLLCVTAKLAAKLASCGTNLAHSEVPTQH